MKMPDTERRKNRGNDLAVTMLCMRERARDAIHMYNAALCLTPRAVCAIPEVNRARLRGCDTDDLSRTLRDVTCDLGNNLS